MTTKQYLGQIERLGKMIENKLIEVEQIRSMACSISAPIDKERIVSTGSHDQMGEKIAQLVDLERETESLVDSYIRKRKHIISQIDKISVRDQYMILTYKYVQQLEFKEIYMKMNISERKMYSLYGQALKEFEKSYGSEYLQG